MRKFVCFFFEGDLYFIRTKEIGDSFSAESKAVFLNDNYMSSLKTMIPKTMQENSDPGPQNQS